MSLTNPAISTLLQSIPAPTCTLQESNDKVDWTEQFKDYLTILDLHKPLTEKNNANEDKTKLMLKNYCGTMIFNAIKDMTCKDSWTYITTEYVKKPDANWKYIHKILQSYKTTKTSESLVCSSAVSDAISGIKNLKIQDVLISLTIDKITQEYDVESPKLKKLLDLNPLNFDAINDFILDSTRGTKDNPIILNSLSSNQSLFCTNCGKFGHEDTSCKRYCSICKVKSHDLTYCRKNKDGNWKNSLKQSNKDSLNYMSSSFINFILDSGATSNIISSRNCPQFTNTHSIQLSDGRVLSATNIGTIQAGNLILNDVLFCPEIDVNIISIGDLTKSGYTINFSNNKCYIMLGNECIYTLLKSNNNIYTINLPCKLIRDNNSSSLHFSSNSNSIIHQRFGHISNTQVSLLKKFISDCGQEIPPTQKFDYDCDICPQSNFKRMGIKHTNISVKTSKILEVVHMDIWSATTISNDGFKYLSTYTDDFSRYSTIFPLKNKSDQISTFIKYKNYTQNQHNTTIKKIKVDNGGEYISKEFISICEENGIEIIFTPPSMPEFNGVAERLNQTLITKARALVMESGVSWKYWPYILQTANLLRNISCTQKLDEVPYKIWHGKEPLYSFIRIFGCKVIYRNINKKNKLEPQGFHGILIGYNNSFTGYKILDTSNNKIYVRTHVKFDETSFPMKSNNLSNLNDFSLQEIDFEDTSIQNTDLNSSNISNTMPSTKQKRKRANRKRKSKRNKNNEHKETEINPSDIKQEKEEEVDKLKSIKEENISQRTENVPSNMNNETINEIENLTETEIASNIESESESNIETETETESSFETDNSYNEFSESEDTTKSTSIYKTFQNIVNESLKKSDNFDSLVTRSNKYKNQTTARRNSIHSIHAISNINQLNTITIPKSYLHYLQDSISKLNSLAEVPNNILQVEKSIHKDKWLSAIKEEEKSLLERDVFSIQEINESIKDKILSYKWVFAHKCDEYGQIYRYKARFCANGYYQRKGIDYDDTFAPVARVATVRLLVSTALTKGHVIHQMDVKTAFLYGNIDKEIYIKCPKQFSTYKEGFCLKLNKSLYGLKQASKIWYQNLKQTLLDDNFIESEASPCLFYRNDTFVLIYVDDILITGTHENVTKVKQYLSNKYQVSDMGEIHQFLNLIFTKINNGYVVTQSNKIQEMLTEYQMEDCNTKSTPMDKQKTDYESPQLINPDKYVEILGKLQYLSRNTRPDITFAVNKLYRSIKNPTEFNWQQVKRILQYLKLTINHGIKITSQTTDDPIRCYVDADFGGDPIDLKSTSGLVAFHNNNPIIWQTAKQDTVSLSTMEAEYYALSEGTKRVIWMKKLLNEIIPEYITKPIPIFEDNQATIKFARGNATMHKRTMHINRKHFFVKDHEIKHKTISIREIASSKNIADIFTKPLAKIMFNKHKEDLCGENKEYKYQKEIETIQEQLTNEL